MLSYQRMGFPHFGQRERGEMTDSPRGRREMQTFKKLPKASPRSATVMYKKIGEICTGIRCVPDFEKPWRAAL